MIKKILFLLLLILLINCHGVKQTYQVLTETQIEKRLLGVWSLIQFGSFLSKMGFSTPGILRFERNSNFIYWAQHKNSRYMLKGKYKIVLPPLSNSQATIIYTLTAEQNLTTGVWGNIITRYQNAHPTLRHGAILFLQDKTAIIHFINYNVAVPDADYEELMMKWKKIAELPPSPEEIAAEKERLQKLQAEERKKQEGEIANRKQQEKEKLMKLLERVPRVVRPGFADF